VTRALRPLLLGFLIWCLAFVALYAVQALGCTWAWPEATHRLILVAIWLAAVAGVALILVAQWRRPFSTEGLIRQVQLWGPMVPLAALLATYFPVTFASLCL